MGGVIGVGICGERGVGGGPMLMGWVVVRKGLFGLSFLG